MDDTNRYVKEIVQEKRSMFPAEDLVRVMLGSYPKLSPTNQKFRILDLGCGEGRNAVFLREIGHDVYGVEVHKDIVKELRNRHPNIRFELGGNKSIPYPDNFFDVIVSWQALYYLDSRGDSVIDNISEMSRCIRKSGKLIACVPFKSNFIYNNSKLVRLDEEFGIEYREISDYFQQRNGAILACFPEVTIFLNLLNTQGFTNHRMGIRRGDWFGLNYDWFTVVSDKLF